MSRLLTAVTRSTTITEMWRPLKMGSWVSARYRFPGLTKSLDSLQNAAGLITKLFHQWKGTRPQ